MGGREFSCGCLNVTLSIELLEDSIAEVDERRLVQALFSDNLEFCTIQKKSAVHEALVSTQDLCEGKWEVTRCENCQLNCYAVDKENNRAVVCPSLRQGPAIHKLRSDPCFSASFGVVVRTKEHLLDQETVKISKTLASHASNAIEQEQLAMEARIHKFMQQQKEDMKQFKEHVMTELCVLSMVSQDVRSDLSNNAELAAQHNRNLEFSSSMSHAIESPATMSESGWSGSDGGEISPARRGSKAASSDFLDGEENVFQFEEDQVQGDFRSTTSGVFDPISDDDIDEGEDGDYDEPEAKRTGQGLNLSWQADTGRSFHTTLSSSLPLAIPERLSQRRNRFPSNTSDLEGESNSSPEEQFLPPHTIAETDFYASRSSRNRDDTSTFERAVLHQSLSNKRSNFL